MLEELTHPEVLTAMLRSTSPPSPADPPVFDGRNWELDDEPGTGSLPGPSLRCTDPATESPIHFSFHSDSRARHWRQHGSVSPAYKAVVARPIDARDPGTLVNIAQRLQSGETMASFSYPDFEAYRDGLRSFSGVIAFSIEQLNLSDADGVVRHRRSDTGPLLSRLGLLPPPAVNAEIAMTFVVSENYFAVLGVAPIRGRALDATI